MHRPDEENPSEEDIGGQNTEETREPSTPAERTQKPKKEPHMVSVKNTVLIAVLSTVIAVIISLQAAFVVLRDVYGRKIEQAYGRAVDFSNLIEVADIFDTNYLYKVDKTELSDDLARAYVALSGDRFASYYSAEEWAAEVANTEGKSAGIGVYVVAMEDGVHVVHVMKNSPSETAKLMNGDIITAVDGESVVGYNISYATSLIAGVADTTVTLTLIRDGKTIEIPVVRGIYEAETVIASTVTMDDGKKYGYIKITKFMSIEVTANQFKAAVNGLLSDGCEGLIFDVRDNPGGRLDAAVEILDFLLPEGPIVHITDLEGNKVMDIKESDKSEIDCPMVVLANGNTASAAELFTSALKDYNKVTIVGTNTFGKGCGQSGFTLSSGAVLYVTTFLYSPPTSPNYDKKGIAPDVEVDLPEEYKNTNLFLLEPKNDTQLLRALEEIQK